jgi:large subunit ribosomal protein L19e|tara:strand:+ start:97 stop:666 length:570 start_codon:yes stop_codon:yes gene_type:complete
MTNLRTRKELASKVLKVGKNRIKFSSENLAEIKEAITKQDIRDLHKEGFISIKPVKGRKKIVRRKTRRGPGKIKKTVNKRKQIYVKITRKLRKYLKELKLQGRISNELFLELRKKIRMRVFRSKIHLREHLTNVEKIDLTKKLESSKLKPSASSDVPSEEGKKGTTKKKVVKKTSKGKKSTKTKVAKKQ